MFCALLGQDIKLQFHRHHSYFRKDSGERLQDHWSSGFYNYKDMRE